MKYLFLLAAVPLCSQISFGESLLVGWDGFEDPAVGESIATVAVENISGSILAIPGPAGTVWWRWDRGSNDGTFGASLAGADTTGTTRIEGALAPAKNVADQDQNYLFLNVSNDSDKDFQLESLVFDLWRPYAGSPDSLTLKAGSDVIGEIINIETVSLDPLAGNVNDYADYSISLDGLTLNSGDSLKLRIIVNDQDTTKFASLYFDNIAITYIDNQEATWQAYPVDSLGWVDTDGWMGWLNVINDPWLWSATLQDWIYFPQQTDTAAGGWIFIPR